MNYGGVVKRALEITWGHKALWLFGVLLALVGAGGRGASQHAQFTVSRGDRLHPGLVLALVAALVLVVVVAMLVTAVVGYLSRGALMGMVQEIEERGNTSVPSGLRIGWSRFLHLLAIDVVSAIPVTLAALVMLALSLSPLVLLAAQRTLLTVVGIILTVGFLLATIATLTIVGLVVTVLRELAGRRCVLEKEGALDCIRAGYRMGGDNLRHVGLIWLLLLAIDLAIGLAAIALVLAMLTAAAVPALVIFALTRAAPLAAATGVVLLLPGVLLLTLARGIYEVFRSATWTVAYLRLPVRSPAD